LLGQVIDHAALSHLFDQARISEQVQHGEIVARQGQTFSTTVTPIPDIGLITVMEDISEIKRLSQLKSEFVSTVSHDLRSPLSAVQGFLSVLDQAGPLNEEQREFVDIAQGEIVRLFKLTEDLLHLGRLDSGIELEMERCDLSTIVEKAVSEWQMRAQEHQHTLSVDLPPAAVYVHGSPRLLRQVLDNLLSNAVKYSLVGGQIVVQLTQAGREAVLQVTDLGIGIASQDQPHVFDRFYRVKNEHTEEIEGTGLGLAIVRSVAERHGGRVWVESELGQGTTIGVALPVQEDGTD
jgi:signal transduction histidine kinase